MLVAFSSPVKFSKSVFFFSSGMKLRAKFEVVQQKHSQSDFSTVNRVADSEKNR